MLKSMLIANSRDSDVMAHLISTQLDVQEMATIDKHNYSLEMYVNIVDQSLYWKAPFVSTKVSSETSCVTCKSYLDSTRPQSMSIRVLYLYRISSSLAPLPPITSMENSSSSPSQLCERDDERHALWPPSSCMKLLAPVRLRPPFISFSSLFACPLLLSIREMSVPGY